MDRERIIKINRAAEELAKKGYCLQGQTKDGRIAVEKKNILFFFSDYIEARDVLLNMKEITLKTNFGEKTFDTAKMSIDVQKWIVREANREDREKEYEYINLDDNYSMCPQGYIVYRKSGFMVSNHIEAQKSEYLELLFLIQSRSL